MSGEELYLPSDWEFLGEHTKTHEWKNYLTDDLRENWEAMPLGVRKMIAKCLQAIADREHWE